MSDLTIRPAQPSDKASVVDLFAEDLSTLRLAWERSRLERVFEALVSDDRAIVLVGAVSGVSSVAGVLVASVVQSVKHGGRSLWIEELYVAQTFRRGGVGRGLVEALMTLASEGSFQGVDLEAYHGNDAAALLYRSLGFRRLGRERFTYRPDWDLEDDDE